MDANQTATLFGSVTLPVKLNNGRDANAHVRQILIREYPQAQMVAGNEIALADLCTSLAPIGGEGQGEGAAPRVTDLDQESYEVVRQKVAEVNAGFFKYAARQVERAAENMKHLPPELMAKIQADMAEKLKAEMVKAAPSSPSSATLPPTAKSA